MGNVLIFKFD